MLSLHTVPDLPSLACPCPLAAPTQTLPVLSFSSPAYWRNKFCGKKRLQGKHNSVHMGWPFTDANLHHTDFVSKTRTGIHTRVPNCNPCPRPSALQVMALNVFQFCRFQRYSLFGSKQQWQTTLLGLLILLRAHYSLLLPTLWFVCFKNQTDLGCFFF